MSALLSLLAFKGLFFHERNSLKTIKSLYNSITIQTLELLARYNKINMYRNNSIQRLLTTIKPHIWFMNSLGVKTNNLIFNPTVPQLYEIAISKKQADETQTKTSEVSSSGAYCAYLTSKPLKKTQNYTRIVQDAQTKSSVHWNKYNTSFDDQSYHLAEQVAIQYLNIKGNCIVVDGYAGWDPQHRLKVRAFCGRSYHALFMKNMLIKPTEKELLEDFSKGVDISIFNAYDYVPAKFLSGFESNSLTAINLREKRITILGNQCASQMKKALFKIFQYYYPRKNILPLQSTATIEKNGKTTLFFGLQDFETTCLGITSQNRKLIGSDEIAWGNNGIFNIEGGCYTKILSQNNKINCDIQNSIRYGALVQNATFYPNSRNLNFYDLTQQPNVKTSFPLHYYKNAHLPSVGTHPQNIILFTCDAHGVLPPVAKLSPQQAFYHFMSGYSCKINQIQQHIINIPKVKFNSCYGEQHLSMHPTTDAKMLYDKIKENKTNVWMVNTGWTQGKYGEGERIKYQDSQIIVDAIINGQLSKSSTYLAKYFNFQVPSKIKGIQQDLLYPQKGWGNKAQFDEVISKLALLYYENYHHKLKVKDDQIQKIIKKAEPTLI